MSKHSDSNAVFVSALNLELEARRKAQYVLSMSLNTNTNTNTNKETDPNGLSASAPGAKLDAGKQRPYLMFKGFSNALDRIAEVTTKGAIKYSPNGWMEVPNGIERYQDAGFRHQLELWQGHKIDYDTGCDHEAQVIWNLLAAYELKLREELKSSPI